MRKFKHKQTKNTADELGDTFYTVKKDKTIICFIPDDMIENTLDWIEIKEPVFTTADGVELHEGDVYYTNIDFEYVNESKVSSTYNYKSHIAERFSTYELAQEYLDNNAPKYSLKDVEEAYNNSICGSSIINQLKNLKK